MKMLGICHIALLPTADEDAFVSHMSAEVFHGSVLQLTRVTSGFGHQLLKRPSELRQYAWKVTAQLVSGGLTLARTSSGCRSVSSSSAS